MLQFQTATLAGCRLNLDDRFTNEIQPCTECFYILQRRSLHAFNPTWTYRDQLKKKLDLLYVHRPKNCVVYHSKKIRQDSSHWLIETDVVQGYSDSAHSILSFSCFIGSSYIVINSNWTTNNRSQDETVEGFKTDAMRIFCKDHLVYICNHLRKVR
jgi:hypothetical protein